MQKILVIQTAFIGDVVLVTGLLEDLHNQYPDASLDILVRQGNESLFTDHPFVRKVLIWNKKVSKYKHLIETIFQIRKNKYDVLINVQRFAATGLITVFSGAKKTIGFDKNPLSVFFNVRIKHIFSKDEKVLHEVERNFQLIENAAHQKASRPRLYPTEKNRKAILAYTNIPYICIAPASVWFTKQFPIKKWIELVHRLPKEYAIYLLGAPSDSQTCEEILNATKDKNVTNLAGKLNFLESAALMENAVMNYVNDSAPMHFASAMNAAVTAIYCSTIPAFGYGPLSDKRFIVETDHQLACRPCGIHGKKTCPEQHFNCAYQIKHERLLKSLSIN